MCYLRRTVEKGSRGSRGSERSPEDFSTRGRADAVELGKQAKRGFREESADTAGVRDADRRSKATEVDGGEGFERFQEHFTLTERL